MKSFILVANQQINKRKSYPERGLHLSLSRDPNASPFILDATPGPCARENKRTRHAEESGPRREKNHFHCFPFQLGLQFSHPMGEVRRARVEAMGRERREELHAAALQRKVMRGNRRQAICRGTPAGGHALRA